MDFVKENYTEEDEHQEWSTGKKAGRGEIERDEMIHKYSPVEGRRTLRVGDIPVGSSNCVGEDGMSVVTIQINLPKCWR